MLSEISLTAWGCAPRYMGAGSLHRLRVGPRGQCISLEVLLRGRRPSSSTPCCCSCWRVQVILSSQRPTQSPSSTWQLPALCIRYEILIWPAILFKHRRRCSTANLFNAVTRLGRSHFLWHAIPFQLHAFALGVAAPIEVDRNAVCSCLHHQLPGEACQITFRIQRVRCAVQKFNGCIDTLRRTGQGWLVPDDQPIHGIGHSNGALLHLLIGSIYAPVTASNVLISFNNKCATAASSHILAGLGTCFLCGA